MIRQREEARGLASRFQAIALVAPPFLPLSARTLSSCPFNPLLFPSSFAEARSDAARRKLTSPRWYLASLSSFVSTWTPVLAVRHVQTKIGHLLQSMISNIPLESETFVLLERRKKLSWRPVCENGTELIAIGLGTVSYFIRIIEIIKIVVGYRDRLKESETFNFENGFAWLKSSKYNRSKDIFKLAIISASDQQKFLW